MKLKANDTVLIMKGRDRGKRGVVQQCLENEGLVQVEGINIIKRHTKPKGMVAGGIIEKEAMINSSNVMLVCTKCDKPSKINYKNLPDGTKARVCKKCLEVIE